MPETVAMLPQPALADVDVSTVLGALADPVRLTIVRELDRVGESTCSALDVPVNASTVSHHLHALREAGVVTTRIDGRTRPSRLRRDDLDERFPGLLSAILKARAPQGAPEGAPAGAPAAAQRRPGRR